MSALGLLAPLAAIPAPDLSHPAVAELAEQFALDVAGVDETQRSAFFAATGDQAFAVVQRIYVHDLLPRVRAVLAALGLPAPAAATPYDGETWPVLESFMASVARLDALDPTLTELVRLRGARLHDCAVCKSRRSQDAIDAGATEDEFAAVDSWATSSLDPRTKAALALVDTIVLTPYDVPVDTLAAARAALSEEEIVEVVLDVMRNAANKLAVALGADAATVTDGVELFRTDSDGNLQVSGTAGLA
ncbi:MAG: carboxymuconolactone decarboxylase family protein [Nocardioidaceae bacterium]|nr:carboxymuconolactone decarboxylase family protein [Nocardioidaceae bacterium]